MRNSQPIQIAKDAKFRKFTVWKVYSEEKAKSVARLSFIPSKDQKEDYSITWNAF